jgi:hypothetical protein
MAVSEDAPQQAVAVTTTALAVCCRRAGSCGCAERLVLGVLVGVLFAVVELLLERLGLLLVGEGQAGQTVLELKRVEEDAVLVVGEGVVDLLVPDDTATMGRYVHHLQPESVADQVVGQHDGALQARVGPSARVGIGNVQLGDGDGVDFVRRLGHGALHRLLVLVGENRRHGGVVSRLEREIVVARGVLECSLDFGRWAWAWLVGRAPHSTVRQHMGTIAIAR